MTEVQERGRGLVDGMDAARRPTGPVPAVLVVVVCWLIANVLGSLLLGRSASAPTIGPFAQAVGTVLVPAMVLLLTAAWLRFKEVRPFVTVGLRARPTGRILAVGALAGLVMFGAVVLGGVATGQLSLQARPALGAGLVVGVLVALVGFAVAAAAEEVQARGYLLQAVHRRWGLIAAVVVQAVLFAALHATSPGALRPLPVLNLLLVAVFLAAWALLEDGLWGVVVWHTVWNWTEGGLFGAVVSGKSFDTSLLTTSAAPGSSDVVTGGAFGLEGGVLTTIVLAVGVGVLLALHRRAHART